MTTDRPVFSVCSGVLAASLLLVLSPSAYADDMGGLWPVKDSAVVSAHESGLDGSVVMADDADSSASYWYVDNMGVRDAWKQDITGEGVKVAVIDSQVVSDYPGFADANISYKAVLENGLASCTAQTKRGTGILKASDSSLKAGERGIYATHGTEMVARIVGNGAGYDGSPGIIGVAPGAEITHTRMVWIAVSAVPQWIRSVRMTRAT